MGGVLAFDVKKGATRSDHFSSSKVPPRSRKFASPAERSAIRC
jgi:hypothetical protein